MPNLCTDREWKRFLRSESVHVSKRRGNEPDEWIVTARRRYVEGDFPILVPKAFNFPSTDKLLLAIVVSTLTPEIAKDYDPEQLSYELNKIKVLFGDSYERMCKLIGADQHGTVISS